MKKKQLAFNILFCLLMILILPVQGQMIKIGNRSKLPVFNSIALRVTKNADYLKWFTDRGMPQSEQLTQDFKEINTKKTSEVITLIYKRYFDSTYTRLFNWIKLDGKSSYQRFILTNPRYFFLMNEDDEELSRIFSYNSKKYFQGAIGFFANANNVFPLFPIWLVILLVMVCVVIWWKRRNVNLILPLILSIIGFVNILVNYNADSMEVERHLYLTRIFSEIIGIISTFFILYTIYLKIKSKRIVKKAKSVKL